MKIFCFLCTTYISIFLSTFGACRNFTSVNESALCLDATNTTFMKSFRLQYLKYTDGHLQSIRIPLLDWASARVAANVAQILLYEVMGYSVILVDVADSNSVEVINYVSGCFDADDPYCVQRDFSDPIVHFTVETGKNGEVRASILPDDIQPKLIKILSYSLSDGWHIWQDTLDESLRSPEHLALDNYRAYNHANFNPSLFFDSWTRIFDLLPGDVIVRCSEMGPNSSHPRRADAYTRATNDSGVTCAHGDAVWFSPACRNSTAECVPLLLVGGVDWAMQVGAPGPSAASEPRRCKPSPCDGDTAYACLRRECNCIVAAPHCLLHPALRNGRGARPRNRARPPQTAYFLNLPVAIVLAGAGAHGNYSEYTTAVWRRAPSQPPPRQSGEGTVTRIRALRPATVAPSPGGLGRTAAT